MPPGHLGAVHRRDEVERHEVALARGPLDGVELGEALAQLVDLLGDVVVVDGRVLDRHRQRVEGRQLELRPDVDLGGEGERLPVVELGDVDLGTPDRRDPRLGDGLGVQPRQGLLHGLLEHDPAADPLVEDARRHLARAEALDAHLRADLLVGAVELLLQVLEGDVDREADPRGAQGLDGALHRGVLVFFRLIRGWARLGARRRARRWERRSGRGDSNSRSPAPKAGALATTLRPA